MIYLILIILLFVWSWCGFNYLKKQIEELQDNLKFKTDNLWGALETVEKDLREDIEAK